MGKLKTFDIALDGYRSVYHPGQAVRGKCVLELKGDMRLKAVRVFMRGLAKVHWTESRSTGNRLGAYTEHYNAELEYFFQGQTLFGSVFRCDGVQRGQDGVRGGEEGQEVPLHHLPHQG